MNSLITRKKKLFTSSSLPPHTSSSWFSSSSTWSSSMRAFNRSSLVCSNNLRRFSLRKSSVSSGVKKKVSSVSEGRSDQPVGESGCCCCWDTLPVRTFASEFGRVSSRRRASYLKKREKKKIYKKRRQVVGERNEEIDFAVVGQISVIAKLIGSRTNGICRQG